MEPITREEYYLAKIAGTYEGKTPKPVTNDEYYLATMAGDYSGNTPQPVTRLQYYMAKVSGVWDGSIPAPVTRLEYYWAAIASGEGKVFPPVTREEHFLVLVADAYSVVLTVVTGNPALLENSKGNRGLESLTLHGKSTQGSTTGAQLFDKSKAFSGWVNSDGSIKNEGTVGKGDNIVSEYIPFEAGKQYYCRSVFVWIYNTEKGFVKKADTELKDEVFTSPDNAGFFVVAFSISAEEALAKLNEIMINVGSVRKPYEPYTGGKPSPSPEYPQEIKSAGDGGSVTVKVTGKNLFPVVTSANLSKINKPDGGVRYGYVFYVPVGSSVAASGNANVYTNCYVGDFDIKTQTYTQKALLVSEKGVANAITLQSGWYVIYATNDYLPSILIKLNGAKIQLEIGAEATAYEPYKSVQKLIVPTPNGLPGIPVSSGGNYTDADGQQWVADEIDLAKGERVQWIGNKVLQESDLKKDTPDSIFVTLYNIKTVSNANPICSHLKYVPYQTADKKQILCISRVLEDIRIYLNSADFQVYKDFVNNNEVFLIWALKTPIRTPIPPETIAAYKALRTYSPTTTVANDAGAGMSVGYKKAK